MRIAKILTAAGYNFRRWRGNLRVIFTFLLMIQRYFMPEDDRLGMIIGYLDKTQEASVCSHMLYRDAFGRNDTPKSWELQEINEVMNAGIASKEIVGWKRYEGTKYFHDYGKQRGWERATIGEPEFTEVKCELPIGLFDK